MKKLFLLIMASLSIVDSMNAQTPVKVRDNLYCYLFQYPNSSEAWVTSGDEPYTGNVEIPQNFWYDGATYEVTKIGDEAFKKCDYLTSVTIPNSVTEIGESSFQDCGLLSLAIPASVTSIGEYAFLGCSELATITVDEGNTVYDSRGGCNAIIRKSDNTLLFGCKNTVIPSSVTAIGDYAFRSCSGMTTLEIPMGVRSIGQDAFDYCTNLASLTIPASVTSIGVNAFMECDVLTSVTVAWATPLNISSKYAFYGCDKLSTATLHVPNGKTEVYSDASYGWNVFGKIEGDGGELPEGVEINETNFPDAKFRNFLLGKDYGLDGILTADELNAVTSLNLNYKGIKDLTGIQYFTKLVGLSCIENEISGVNMFKLIYSLPLKSTLGYLLVKKAGSNPDNVMTKNQVALAESRGWYPYIVNEEDDEVRYYGEDLTITANFFPDENFRNYLKEQDYGQDGILTKDELENVAMLYLSSKNIADLTGIEYFTKMSILYCNENKLESLDISQNKELVTLGCPVNKLTSLDVSGCLELGSLFIYGNNITGDAMTALVNSLPVRTVSSEFLVCSDKLSPDNTITTAQAQVAKDKGWTVTKNDSNGKGVDYAGFDPIAINETNFPDAKFRAIVKDKAINTNEDDYLSEKEVIAVTDLDLTTKEIGKLDGIGFFTELTRLICQANFLNKLDVTKNTKLKILNCQMNALSVLDLSQNKALTTLSCGFNGLSALDFSNNTALTGVSCEGNKIKGESMTALVNSLPAAEEGVLYVVDDHSSTDNIITTAQAKIAKDKGWTVMKYNGAWQPEEYAGFDPIAINETNFPDQKFREYLIAQDYGKDGVLTEIELRAVTVMDVSNKGISNLKGIEYFTKLTNLNCSQNSLTSLDVSKNMALVYLDCYMNTLGSLNVSNHAELSRLTCTQCGLTSLDVSNCPKLTKLECFRNKIEGTEMDKLVNGMPSVTGICWFNVCDDYITPDNIITAAQVKVARDKGWSVMKRQSIFYGGVNYAGWGDVNGDNKIDEADLDAISMIIMGKMADIDVGIEGKYIDSQFAGDLNNDMKTDAADIVIMVNILNGFNAQQQIDNVQEQNSNNKLQ